VVPTAWRNIIVPETIKLRKLHQSFQTSLGWTNSRLHEFVIAGARYSEPDTDSDDEFEHTDEGDVPLQKALGMDVRSFDYVYDFGDDWHHLVLVKDLLVLIRDYAPLPTIV
jgi:Plasmid pRiA4b ORF-3-like protein